MLRSNHANCFVSRTPFAGTSEPFLHLTFKVWQRLYERQICHLEEFCSRTQNRVPSASWTEPNVLGHIFFPHPTLWKKQRHYMNKRNPVRLFETRTDRCNIDWPDASFKETNPAARNTSIQIATVACFQDRL